MEMTMSPRDFLAAAFAHAETRLALGDPMDFGALLFRDNSPLGLFVALKGSFDEGFPELLSDLDYLSEMALQVEADAACLLMLAPACALPVAEGADPASTPLEGQVLVAALHLCDHEDEIGAVFRISDQDGVVLVEAPPGVRAPGILSSNLFTHEAPHRRDEVASDLAARRMLAACPAWVRSSAPVLH
jgi:hypothetical protein